jgi:UDP-N-acetyl-D-glucosamine dehydrogenase
VTSASTGRQKPRLSKDEIVAKFHAGDAQVAVIGLGYVGLPLALAFAEAGYQTVGIDLNRARADQLNRGESYIEDISNAALAPYVRQAAAPSAQDAPQGSLRAVADYAVIAECDAVSICVPTPLNKTGDPDMSYIVAAAEAIATYLHPGLVVVLESTTYPGTTREILLEIFEKQSLAAGRPLMVGEDIFVAFSPERVDPGRKDYLTRNTPKVIGGITPACLEVATAFYARAIDTLVPVSSPEAAEMAKLLENTFRAVNIGLANELLLICDKLGLDAWEIIDAAATKPFGFMRFTPGPGLGGHCIPIDPLYLSWKLRSLEYNARFIQLAGEINTEMPRYWVQKVQDLLNEQGKAVNGSRILLLGVAYKKDVSDLRESPALDIMHLLQAKGARVDYHDPYVPTFAYEGMTGSSVRDLDQAVADADIVVITTDHSVYRWAEIRAQARLIVDTRHVV